MVPSSFWLMHKTPFRISGKLSVERKAMAKPCYLCREDIYFISETWKRLPVLFLAIKIVAVCC